MLVGSRSGLRIQTVQQNFGAGLPAVCRVVRAPSLVEGGAVSSWSMQLELSQVVQQGRIQWKEMPCQGQHLRHL